MHSQQQTRQRHQGDARRSLGVIMENLARKCEIPPNHENRGNAPKSHGHLISTGNDSFGSISMTIPSSLCNYGAKRMDSCFIPPHCRRFDEEKKNLMQMTRLFFIANGGNEGNKIRLSSAERKEEISQVEVEMMEMNAFCQWNSLNKQEECNRLRKCNGNGEM